MIQIMNINQTINEVLNPKGSMFNYPIKLNNNNSSNKIVVNRLENKEDQLTTMEKLALLRAVERINRKREIHQESLCNTLDSLNTKSNFQDTVNQIKLNEVFEIVKEIKLTYPDRKVLSKIPEHNQLPPYKSIRLENKALRNALKKRSSLFPGNERIFEAWY